MLSAARSDIGRIRQTNEDCYGVEEPYLYIVADGMGGHLAGEVASQIAVATIKSYVASHKDGDYESWEDVLYRAIEEANGVIYKKARANVACSGMGTTVSLLFYAADKIYWAHVGDSRIYLLRGGKLRQITKDHSLVGRLLESGSITSEEARVHPQRNMLTRAVGVEAKVAVDTGAENAQEGDRWLLCTDGLTSMVGDRQVEELLREEKEPQKALDHLVAAALHAGGADNVTAVLVDL